MKRIALLFMLLLLFGCLSPKQTEEIKIKAYLTSKGINADVHVNNGIAIISFEKDVNVEQLFDIANGINAITGNFRIEVLRNKEPYIALTVVNGGVANAQIEDIRSPANRIMDEIAVLDFAGNVKVDEDVRFYGIYFGRADEFFDQLASASLLAFEYAPWTKKAIFTIGPFIYIIDKENLLEFLEGKINEDMFINSIEIKENKDYTGIKITINETNEGETGLDCNNEDYAYKQYVKYYNEVTQMMHDANNNITINETKLNESYKLYEYWRACYLNLTKE